MKQIDELLENIRVAEFKRRIPLAYSTRGGDITRTADIFRKVAIKNGDQPVTFKTSKLYQIFMVMIIANLWYLLLSNVLVAGPMLSIFMVVGIGLSFYLLKRFFLDKRFNYGITLSGSGIQINKDFYYWGDVL